MLLQLGFMGEYRQELSQTCVTIYALNRFITPGTWSVFLKDVERTKYAQWKVKYMISKGKDSD